MARSRLLGSARLLGALSLAAGLLAANVRADDAERQPAPKTPKCVDVRSFSRYGALGYDHIVEVTNRCDKPVACTVKTDVNPEPSRMDVGPGETHSTVTFRGSPASEFRADVTCERKG